MSEESLTSKDIMYKKYSNKNEDFLAKMQLFESDFVDLKDDFTQLHITKPNAKSSVALTIIEETLELISFYIGKSEKIEEMLERADITLHVKPDVWAAFKQSFLEIEEKTAGLDELKLILRQQIV